MNIRKSSLPDGRQGITIYAEPDIISEMVALCKQRNIAVEESPDISPEVMESLMKSIKKDTAISRVEEIAKSFKNKSKPQTQTLEERLKQIADKE